MFNDPNDPGPGGVQSPAPANLPAVGPSAPVRIVETNTAAAAAREKAAIEARALVAMHRPRNFETSRLRLLTACKRPGFALVARYAKPIGGNKTVDGLSVRFAEEARVLWGNMAVDAFVAFDDEERRVYRVVGSDLETNAHEGVDVVIEKFVERRQPRQGQEVIRSRTNSSGQVVYLIRATEDDLLVKVNALIAKARRNVILSLIPGDVKEECEALCIDTVRRKDAEDPEAAKRAVLGSFFELGVTPDQVAQFLGHSPEALNPAEIHLLRKIYQGIRDGEATWAEVMETRGADASATTGSTAGKGTAGLKDALNAKRAGNGGAPPVDTRTQEEKDLEEDRRIQAEEEARAKGGKR
jgi:hypothetical protein